MYKPALIQGGFQLQGSKPATFHLHKCSGDIGEESLKQNKIKPTSSIQISLLEQREQWWCLATDIWCHLDL